MRGVRTRIVPGRAGVVREVRAAAPLMAAVSAPIPARGPWLTAVLHAGAPPARPAPARPVAVVVERDPLDPPAGVALLSVQRRGAVAVVSVLGQTGVPLPGGRPSARLFAADDDAAAELSAGICTLLGSLRGPWALRLTGLPLGDPTLRALAGALPESVLANVRSSRLIDELTSVARGRVVRSRDAAALERWLPTLLARRPDPSGRRFLRTAARWHAAIGQLELAVVPDGSRVQAAVLTLLDGADRWPWWGSTDVGGLRTEMGSPLVSLTARGGWRLPQLPVPELSTGERPIFLRLPLPGRGRPTGGG